MNNPSNLRLYYTRLLLIGILGTTLLIGSLSLSNNPAEFEKKFWNRDLLISGFTNIRWMVGDRVYSQGLRGKDGWLEYTGDGNIDNYQNANPASPEDLEKIGLKIRRLNRQLQDKNITLLIVVAPNKATIYPDKLADEIQKLGPESYLDQLGAYLKQNGPNVLLDLRSALQAGRKTREIYYVTDTHWNGYGAFIGYTSIVQTLSKKYPQLKPRTIDEFDIQTGQGYQHDIPKLMGANNILEPGIVFVPKQDNVQWSENLTADTIIPMQIATTTQSDAPSLLIYADSFGIAIKNLLPQHFSKTIFIQNSSRSGETLSMQKLDTIKPNIVIIEFVERSVYSGYLDRLLSLLLAPSQK